MDILLTSFVIIGSNSLRMIENSELREALQYFTPDYVLPSRSKLTTRLLPQARERLNASIRIKLSEMHRFSLTSDGWTSVSKKGFVTVTLHGVDADWKLQSFVLRLAPVSQSEDAAVLALIVHDTLLNWSLSIENLISNTTDGARTGSACVRILLKKQWVYCVAHALSRAYHVSIDANPILRAILVKASTLCIFFRLSLKENFALESQALKLGLKLKKLTVEVETRWNSVFKMLKRLLRGRPAVSLCLSENLQMLETRRLSIQVICRSQHGTLPRGCLRIFFH